MPRSVERGPRDMAAPAASRPPNAAELASARRLFAIALSAEDQGRWAEALETYERIRKIVVSPSLWYHIGVCHEALGEVVEALNAFELALSGATARKEVALARESRSRIEALRARASQIVLRLPDDAAGVRVEIDGDPIHPALVGAAILVTPGARRVVVEAENYTETFEATVQADTGALVELRAELGRKRSSAPPRRRAPVRPAPRGEPAPDPLLPAEVVVGTAAALAVGAVITGALAYDVRHSYLKENADPAPGSLGKREALYERGQALAITSTALTGAALLAGGFATYLFWPSSPARSASPDAARSSASRPRAPGPTALSPWIGPDGAGVALRGSL
ncbi:tetratricopeptide repeat protein [Sorangium sp. So ce1036]|uniref:hypothetical protein n=1 Tax=Sorangium sp. So ce1036 TaxID=3133328 RepID=UPI003F0C1747